MGLNAVEYNEQQIHIGIGPVLVCPNSTPFFWNVHVVQNSIFYGAFYDSFMEMMVKHMHPHMRIYFSGYSSVAWSIAMTFPPLRKLGERASVCVVCVDYVCESEHTTQRKLNCVVSILMRCFQSKFLCVAHLKFM